MLEKRTSVEMLPVPEVFPRFLSAGPAAGPIPKKTMRLLQFSISFLQIHVFAVYLVCMMYVSQLGA